MTKSRSRPEIWARSRFRRLRSRLHHCRKHVSITSILFDNNKHRYRNYKRSLETFVWYLHRLSC